MEAPLADCDTDLVVSARASFATHQAHLAVAELTAWRETAPAVAPGLGGTDLVGIDESEPVERPSSMSKPERVERHLKKEE